MFFPRREVNAEARNLLCPAYGTCLSSAIKKNSTGFSCSDCLKRKVEEPIPADEPRRCADFLQWVFYQTEKFHWVQCACPRCGKRYRRETRSRVVEKRRLCNDCLTYSETYLNQYTGGVELRGLSPWAMPIEPEFEEGET